MQSELRAILETAARDEVSLVKALARLRAKTRAVMSLDEIHRAIEEGRSCRAPKGKLPDEHQAMKLADEAKHASRER